MLSALTHTEAFSILERDFSSSPSLQMFQRLTSHANDISSARRWSNMSRMEATYFTPTCPRSYPRLQMNHCNHAHGARYAFAEIHGRVNAGNVRPGKTRKSSRDVTEPMLKRKHATCNSPTVIIVRARTIHTWCIDLLRTARIARREKSILGWQEKSTLSRILKRVYVFHLMTQINFVFICLIAKKDRHLWRPHVIKWKPLGVKSCKLKTITKYIIL